MLYATFSTPVNSIGASAVCAFRLRDISDAFAGRFKEQGSVSANWLPVEEHKVPSPRPGACLNDSKSLPDINLNFIRNHVSVTLSHYYSGQCNVQSRSFP